MPDPAPTAPTAALPARTPEAASAERVRINVSWLLKLRRAGVVGQLVTIAVALWGLGVALPLFELVLVVLLGHLTNVGLQVWYWRTRAEGDARAWLEVGPHVLGGVLLLDVLLLTGLLYFSGGVGNPFCIFYFVNLVLSTVVLGGAWLGAVFAAALLSFAALMFFHEPLPWIGGPALGFARGVDPGLGDLSLWARGELVAFFAVAVFTGYFVRRLNAELSLRDAEVAEERRRRETMQRLEALATLAAGAAHELASPLSTITVVARELERELERSDEAASALEDVRLVRDEVARCRSILDQMSLDAGDTVGEEMAVRTPRELVERALSKLVERRRVRVEVDPRAADLPLRVPTVALTRALRGLLKNALDATPGDAPVGLAVEPQGAGVAFVVSDAGAGMDAATLERAGDPFFTTKEPGAGMGLGLFLARTLADRLGGSLRLESHPERGTVATLELPAAGVGR